MATPRNTSVQKAFQILEAFSPNGCQLSATEVAKRTQMTVATVHRFLLTLENLGVVSRTGDNRFQLGTLLAELGGRVEHNKVMTHVVEPHVDSLAEQFGERVNVALLSGKKVIQIAVGQDARSLQLGMLDGNVLPVYCTAAGRVLLAGLRSKLLDYLLDDIEFESYTDNSLSSREELVSELHRVKAQGYALNFGELTEQVSCLAVPICDDHNEVVAALSVSVSKPEISAEQIENYRSTLAHHAEQIRRELYMENRVLPYKAKPRGSFPHAKRIGDFILVSGTSARQQDDSFPGVVQGSGGKAVVDMRRQAHAALQNLFDIVESFGAKREDIVEIQAFLVSMKDYEVFNEVYGEYFDYSGPTRTTVAVSELPHPHQMLMLKAMAYKPVPSNQ